MINRGAIKEHLTVRKEELENRNYNLTYTEIILNEIEIKLLEMLIANVNNIEIREGEFTLGEESEEFRELRREFRELSLQL